MTKIRVLLADDHETVRQGLKLIINSQRDMEVVAEAGDGQAAVEQACALRPSVVVMDVSMPTMNGLKATRGIRAAAPESAVVALTRYGDEAYVRELLDAGAVGYVLKQSPSAELVTAVRAAAAGRQHMDSSLAERVSGTMSARRGRGRARVRITDRETAALRLMALGHSNKEIASQLDLSVKTVEVHKTNAMRKLGLSGRTDVVRYASLLGWLRDP